MNGMSSGYGRHISGLTLYRIFEKDFGGNSEPGEYFISRGGVVYI
jgi:hypothetical protein